MNRKIVIFISLIFALSSISGCASMGWGKKKGKGSISGQEQAYSGPKAKITLTSVEIKSPKAVPVIGSSFLDKLTNALKESNRFLFVEPQVSTDTQAKGPGPDLIIATVITEFEPQVSGGSAGSGGGGSAAGAILGGLLGTPLTNAHIAVEIRIVNTSTSEVLSSTLVKGQSSEGMEQAMRGCVIEAARYISQAIPANYYKY